MAEGGSRITVSNTATYGNITLTQSLIKNKDVCNLIDKLMNELEKLYNIKYKRFVNNNIITWSLTDLRIVKFFNQCGNMYTKRIPNEIKNFSSEYLMELIYYYGLGDGRKTIRHKRIYNNLLLDNIKDIFSVSEQLMDDMQYLVLKCGIGSSKRQIITTKDYNFGGHIIKASKKRPLFVVSFLASKGTYLDKRMVKIQKYNVKNVSIKSLIIKNSSYIIRYNGKCIVISVNI